MSLDDSRDQVGVGDYVTVGRRAKGDYSRPTLYVEGCEADGRLRLVLGVWSNGSVVDGRTFYARPDEVVVLRSAAQPVPISYVEARELWLLGANRRCAVCGSYGAGWTPHGLLGGSKALCIRHQLELLVELRRHEAVMAALRVVNFPQDRPCPQCNHDPLPAGTDCVNCGYPARQWPAHQRRAATEYAE